MAKSDLAVASVCFGRGDRGGGGQCIHRILGLGKLDLCIRIVELRQYLTGFHRIANFDVDLFHLSAAVEPECGFGLRESLSPCRWRTGPGRLLLPLRFEAGLPLSWRFAMRDIVCRGR